MFLFQTEGVVIHFLFYYLLFTPALDKTDIDKRDLLRRVPAIEERLSWNPGSLVGHLREERQDLSFLSFIHPSLLPSSLYSPLVGLSANAAPFHVKSPHFPHHCSPSPALSDTEGPTVRQRWRSCQASVLISFPGIPQE